MNKKDVCEDCLQKWWETGDIELVEVGSDVFCAHTVLAGLTSKSIVSLPKDTESPLLGFVD